MKLQLTKIKSHIAAWAVVWMLVWSGGAVHALPADLDGTFGSNGSQTINVGLALQPLLGHANATVIQPDGKILIAGDLLTNGKDRFAVVRLNADGSYDRSFGVDGRVTVGVTGGFSSASALRLQPDGKIVVVGYGSPATGAIFAVVRLRTNGSLDNSFAGGGKLLIPIGTAGSVASAVALQSDGKIVVTGYGFNGNYKNFAVARLNSSGTLDSSFDSDGKLLISMSVTNSSADDLAVQNDGKIVLAGYGYDLNTGRDNFAAARLNADGSLDSGFSNGSFAGGKLFVTFSTETSTNATSRAFSVALQADGKILLGGSVSEASPARCAVARLNSDGSADLSFDGDGKTDFAVGTSGSTISALTVQADGNIVAAGTARSNSYNDFAVARLTPNGSLDNSYGSAGTLLLPLNSTPSTEDDSATAVSLTTNGSVIVAGFSRVNNVDEMSVYKTSTSGILDDEFHQGIVLGPPGTPGNDYANAIATQSDGKILVTGTSFSNNGGSFGVGRLNADGTLDTSFNADGNTPGTLSFSTGDINDVAVQSDGKIILAGNVYKNNVASFAIVRLQSDGTFDSSFGAGGKVILLVGGYSPAYSVNIQPDGKIVVAGSAYDTVSGMDVFALCRLNMDGTLDASFGSGGKVSLPVGIYDSNGTSVTVCPDGKIIVGGKAQDNVGVGFALVRLLGNGNLDNSFDGDGKLIIHLGSGFSTCNAIALQQDGNIVAVGYGIDVSGHTVIAAARILANGGLDTNFATGGKLFLPTGSANSIANGVALQKDGKIVLAGFASNGTGNTFAVVRLLKSGALDTSFDGDGKLLADLSAYNSGAADVLVKSDGKILLGGTLTRSQFSDSDFAVVQLIGGDGAKLSVTDATAAVEGDAGSAGSASFTVTLSAPETHSVTVAYTTVNGTAKTGIDYLAKNGTLTFAPGETTKTITVDFVGDNAAELNETFFLDIQTPTNATILKNRGNAMIKNDDGPLLSINSAVTSNEGNSGTTPFVFTVTLAQPNPQTVSVQYAAIKGTTNPALVGSDFLSTKGVLTFNPGDTTKIISVPIVGDYQIEANETFFVTLSKSVNATISAGQAVGSITNDDFDDVAPTVSFTTTATNPVGTTPVSGNTIYSTIPAITGVAADTDSGVARVQLRLYRASTSGAYEYWTGTAWTSTVTNLNTVLSPTTGGANVTWSKSSGWPTGADFTNGTYYLRALAYDRAGNSSATLASSFKKAIDSTAPTVNFTTSATTPTGTTPVNGGTVSKTMPTITGVAADSGSGVAQVQLRLYRATAGGYEYWTGTAWTTTVTNLSTVLAPLEGGASVTWSRTSDWASGNANFTDGTYYLRALAYDRAGNITATTASSFQKVEDAPQAQTTISAHSSADASAARVILDFVGEVPEGDFAVMVNGVTMPIHDTKRAAQSVTLLLSEGTLHVDDQVVVSWPGGTQRFVAE